jgi:DNA-binding CsgD family transcriptional regulator
VTTLPKRRELTARELEILDLHAAGYVRADIAARLDISAWTVASHLRRITAALGANGPVNLIHKAWQLGLFQREAGQPPAVEEIRYLVWSHEANAWWGPGGHGYRADIQLAGRFTQAEAVRACGMRSWRSPARPPEVHVPAPECWGVTLLPDAANRHMAGLIQAATRQAVAALERQAADNRTTTGATA